MRRERYDRLGDRARRRRADGSRGWRARRAFRKLVHLSDRGDRLAEQALRSTSSYPPDDWLLWLRDPTDETWMSARNSGRPPAADAGAVSLAFTEATDGRRDAATRARIGAFCTRHGMAPAEPADRALFLVMTGQPEQHRALDPDGELLAAAYEEAAEPTRAAVRQALADAGDLDLVRVIAERRRLVVDMTGGEVDQLARRLARAADWEQLWRLVTEAPIGPATAAVRLCGAWRPAGAADRHLFDVLAAVPPETVAAAARALRAAPEAGCPVLTYVTDASFAPDLSQVAVASSTAYKLAGGPFDAAVDVFALPDGRHLARHRSERYRIEAVLHLGAAIVTHEVSGGLPVRPYRHRLVHRAGGTTTVLGEYRAPAPQRWGLARIPGGFVAAPSGGPGGLLRGAADGSRLDRVRLAELAGQGHRTPPVLAVAADPASGRVAVADRFRGLLAVLDDDLRPAQVLAIGGTGTRQGASALLFAGPDRLVTQHQGAVRLWRWDERTATEAARPQPQDCRSLAALPATGHLLAVAAYGTEVICWDAASLVAVEAPVDVSVPYAAHGVWSSAGGEYVAVGVAESVQLRGVRPGPAAELLLRPVGRMVPADLPRVAAAAREAGDPAVRQALELLRACLEHRFGAEVEIGRPAPGAAAEDVALGGEDGPPC
jgi:hypothetical protein